MQLRVHIIEARNLQPCDSNGLADPVCYFIVGNKTKKTQDKYKTLECTWDAQFVFNFKNISILQKKCRFDVYDNNIILGQKLIGSHTLEVNVIYNKPQHSLINQWIAITNENGISGYLLISISVLAKNDSLPVYIENSTTDHKSLQSLILIPPKIPIKETTLSIKLYEGIDFPKQDLFSSNDNYVEITFGNNTLQTNPIKNNDNPNWDVELLFPVIHPIFINQINIKVKDYNTGSFDKTIATTSISYNSIINGDLAFGWIYFYEDMTYIGKILVDFYITNDKTAAIIKKINNRNPPNYSKVSIVLDLFEITELPILEGKVKFELSSGKNKSAIIFNIKKHTAKIYQQIHLITDSINQKLFMKIYNGSNILCQNELLINETELEWKHFQCNLLMQLHVNENNVPIIKQPVIQQCQLTIQLFGAYTVQSSNKIPMKCSHCSVNFGPTTYWSERKIASISPWWNEQHTFDVELSSIEKNELIIPPIIITFYDIKNVIIDTVRISLEDKDIEDILKPTAYISKNGTTIIIATKPGKFTPIEIPIITENYNVNIISVTELQSRSILPIQNLQLLLNRINIKKVPCNLVVPIDIIQSSLFPSFIYAEVTEFDLIGNTKLLGTTIISIDNKQINDLPYLIDQIDIINEDEDDETTITPEGIEEIKEMDDNFDRKILNYEIEKELNDIPFRKYYFCLGDKNGNSFRTTGKLKLQLNKSKQIVKEELFVIRVYVLDAENLILNDTNNLIDPYIIIKSKNKIINDKQNKVTQTLFPNFYNCYELVTTIPDSLVLQIWNADIVQDDYLGETIIELEDRYYSKEWRRMQVKPIEKRTLWNSSTDLACGTINLWVEILSLEKAKNTPKTAIMPKIPLDCELRVIIWNTKDVKFKDANMSDIYVTGILEETGEEQKTDIHWRSMNGKGAFNWRMIYELQIPGRYPRFKIQLWDKDIFHSDQSIAEATLNLKSVFKKMYRENHSIQKIPKQWINLIDSRTLKKQGSVELSIEILTKLVANCNLVGKGRNNPDALPSPHRPASSFHPLRFDKYIVESFWNKKRNKIYFASTCCCFILILFVIGYFL